ncbi:MAG: ParA family protein [Pseudomonadota bacterium]
MIRVIFNQKGGVGKTSITCNLAAVTAQQARKVVVIDLDTQCNTSHYLSGHNAFEQTIADYLSQVGSVLFPSKNITHFVHETPFKNLFLIPASESLSSIEHSLESRYKIYKLRDGLMQLQEIYDDIYIDTPPAFNFFTKSALIGAHRVLIPFDCDAFSRQSLDKVMTAIIDICEDHNPDLLIEGIIANQFQPRAKLPLQLVNEMKEEGLNVLPIKLTNSVKMRESHQVSKPLIYLAPKHDLTLQFIQLYQMLNQSSHALNTQEQTSHELAAVIEKPPVADKEE